MGSKESKTRREFIDRAPHFCDLGISNLASTAKAGPVHWRNGFVNFRTLMTLPPPLPPPSMKGGDVVMDWDPLLAHMTQLHTSESRKLQGTPITDSKNRMAARKTDSQRSVVVVNRPWSS